MGVIGKVTRVGTGCHETHNRKEADAQARARTPSRFCRPVLLECVKFGLSGISSLEG
jgi:hypothetical protein